MIKVIPEPYPSPNINRNYNLALTLSSLVMCQNLTLTIVLLHHKTDLQRFLKAQAKRCLPVDCGTRSENIHQLLSFRRTWRNNVFHYLICSCCWSCKCYTHQTILVIPHVLYGSICISHFFFIFFFSFLLTRNLIIHIAPFYYKHITAELWWFCKCANWEKCYTVVKHFHVFVFRSTTLQW